MKYSELHCGDWYKLINDSRVYIRSYVFGLYSHDYIIDSMNENEIGQSIDEIENNPEVIFISKLIFNQFREFYYFEKNRQEIELNKRINYSLTSKFYADIKQNGKIDYYILTDNGMVCIFGEFIGVCFNRHKKSQYRYSKFIQTFQIDEVDLIEVL